MRTLIVLLFLGSLASLLLCARTAILQPLMIVNVSETQMSPIDLWMRDMKTVISQNTTTEDLFNSALGSVPFVSSRIDEWDDVRPVTVVVSAVNYARSELQTLEEIRFDTTTVGNSSFNSWMKNDYLSNKNRIREQIESPTEGFWEGSLFRYKYTTNYSAGEPTNSSMALLWDEQHFDQKGLLLTSNIRNIGTASDIRSNLGIHTYVSTLHVVETQDMGFALSERISLQNQKITRTNHTTIQDALSYLRFDMEEGVIVKSLEVIVIKGDSNYNAKLKPIKGELLTEHVQESGFIFTDQYDLKCSHLEIIAVRNIWIYSMAIEIKYSYLPYDVADYLVIQGLYSECNDPPHKPFTVVAGTGTTEGSVRKYYCEDGASLENGYEPAVIYCFNGNWANPYIECAINPDEQTFPSSTISATSSTISITKREISYPTLTSLAETTMTNFAESTTTIVEATSTQSSTISITESEILYPTSTSHAETTMTNFAESTTTLVEATSTPSSTISITEREMSFPTSTSIAETTTTSFAESTTTIVEAMTNRHSSTTGKEILIEGVPTTTITTGTDNATESNTLTDVMTAVTVSTHPPTTTNATTQFGVMTTQATRCTRLCFCGSFIWGKSTLENLEPEVLTEVLRTVSELKSRLAVKKTTLSSYKATKMSAPDKRHSATGIGAAGIVIIVFVVLVIIMVDGTSFLSSKQNWKIRPAPKEFHSEVEIFCGFILKTISA